MQIKFFKNITFSLVKRIIAILILNGFFSSTINSQECHEYHNFSKFVNCRQCINSHYKIYLKPQNITIGIYDTLTYNIEFTGNRDYIISFCADQVFYPINIQLYNSNSKNKIYDNAINEHKCSIKVGIKNTQNILIKVTFLAENCDEARIKSDVICLGMILQWRKMKKNRINDI